jgi:hypothetical protein
VTQDRTLPDAVRQKLAQLQDATRSMPALEEELAFLAMRLENGDMRAAHLALRSTTEALLRHAARVEKQTVQGDGTIRDLEQALRRTKKVSDDFWVHLKPVQAFGNRDAHSHADDVYHRDTLKPAKDPWPDVEVCLINLAQMAREFVATWPPPPGMTMVDPPRAAKEEEDEEKDDTAPRGNGKALPDVTGEQVVAYIAQLTAKQALEDEEVRVALELITGLQRRGVTRRLNAANGRTKVRNIFPERFAASPRGAETIDTSVSEEDESPFDYEAIGNLTISQARDLGMAESIARLTNSTELGVKRKLGQLNGNGVVRRQFSWYEAATIGELTVRTALDYRMAPLLARHLRRRASTITEMLRGAPGQTKLRTIFPALDD